jgi:hypothetical protein
MFFDLPASAHEEREILSKLDSFNPLLVLLNVGGMLPSIGTYSSRCKYIFYRIFSAATFISYIPLIVMQVMGIYKHSGNLMLVTAIIFQLAAYFDGMVTMAYFIYHRKRLLNTFYLMENKFNPFMKKVGIPEKQAEIIGRNKKFEIILSMVAMGAFLADMCTWCVLPSIVRYFAYLGEEETVDDDDYEVKEHFEYFILVMWLPQRATEFPVYEMLHVLQFFSVWGVVANYASGKLITVSIFYHLSNQFRILATAIEDIDLLCNDDDPAKDENKLLELMMVVKSTPDDTNVSANILNRNNVRGGRNSVTKFSVIQTQNSGGQLDTSSVNSANIFAAEFMLLSGAEDCEDEVTYLTNCIRYHQALLG